MGSTRRTRIISISDELGSIEVLLSYRRSGSIVLRVGQAGTVRLGAPFGTPDAAIEDLLKSKAVWIRASTSRIEALRCRLAPFTSGAGFPASIELMGSSAQVVAVKSQRQDCLLDGDTLRVYARDPEDGEAVSRQINEWYKRNALEIAADCMEMYWADFALKGLEKPAIRVRTMQTRWGSYSRRSNSISLNAALIKAPCEYMEYVVAHELAHLVHLDHSPGFRAVLSDLMPDWKERRSGLRAWATAGTKGQFPS